MRAVVRNIFALGRAAQSVDTFRGPHLGPKMATRTERTFSAAQLAEAKAMPSRWTNVGRSFDASAVEVKEPVRAWEKPSAL